MIFRLKILAFLGIFLLTAGWNYCVAQNYPIYSNYIFNSYLYNPASIGSSGFASVDFNYRLQWAGVEDAPKNQTLTFQYPTFKKIAFGANFYSDQSIFLNNSVFLLTGAYKVELGTSSLLNFGLSLGAGFNSLSIEDPNPDDPAVNDNNNSTYVAGQFGVEFATPKLKIGLSLPQLFDSKANANENFQGVEFNSPDFLVTYGRYLFEIPNSKFAFEPIVLYRGGDSDFEQLDVSGLLYYNNLIWLGALYRNNYGFAALFGLNINDKLLFNYSYEVPTQIESNISNQTHEFGISLRFGKNKKQKGVQPLAISSDENTLLQRIDESSTATVVVVESAKKDEAPESEATVHLQPDTSEENESTREEPSTSTNELKKGIYLVAGVFESEDNARRFLNAISLFSEEAGYGYNPIKNFYYVYFANPDGMQSAKDKIRKYKNIPEFSDTWVYVYE